MLGEAIAAVFVLKSKKKKSFNDSRGVQVTYFGCMMSHSVISKLGAALEPNSQLFSWNQDLKDSL